MHLSRPRQRQSGAIHQAQSLCLSTIQDATGNIQMEANVSADLRFDLALKLLLNGYTLWWAMYSLGFKEDVSLTVVDELAQWQKCAYSHGTFG
jgi:Glycosyl transferase family group 2